MKPDQGYCIIYPDHITEVVAWHAEAWDQGLFLWSHMHSGLIMINFNFDLTHLSLEELLGCMLVAELVGM